MPENATATQQKDFEVKALPENQAQEYWKKLAERNLNRSNNGEPSRLGHPFELESTQAEELKQGAISTHKVLKEAVKNTGGVTEWMKGRPVMFGEHNLNINAINSQLEKRLDAGYGLPLEYDVLMASEHGKPSMKILEVQTGISYETSLASRLEAGGYNPEDPHTRFGKENPSNRYKSFREKFAGGEPIVVMDTDPFDATRVEKVGMQKNVGGENTLPISPIDLIGKDEKGYYYHPYQTDPENPMDAKRDENGNPLKDTTKVDYAKNVLARMAQPDLDELWEKVKNTPEKTKLIADFLKDSNVNWIWHPNWQHIADKAVLPMLRGKLLENGDPAADQFVPIYSAGDEVTEPGEYIKKPLSSQHGTGQERVSIREGQRKEVEDDHVYQKVIKPYPTRTYLPGHLAAKMRTDSQKLMREEDLQKPDELRPVVGNQVELRVFFPPFWNDEVVKQKNENNEVIEGDERDEAIGRFMARVGPRRTAPDSLKIAQTNAGSINEALNEHLSKTNDKDKHILYPYGVSPVVIVDKNV